MRWTGNRLWLVAGLAAGLVAMSVSPGVAVAVPASSVTGTVTFAGTAPPLKPLAMDADPACAKKHSTPVPNEMLVLGSGNTMGNIMVYVSKGIPAGKTYPAPTTPVVLDQNGCQVQAARDGDHGRSALQDPQLRRHPPQCPRASQDQHAIQQADAGDAQGNDRDVPQAGGELPDQVRRAPMDERLHGRLQPSLLLGDGHGREVHDLGPRPGDLRDHRLAREAGDADGLGHGCRQRYEDPGLQVRLPAAK